MAEFAYQELLPLGTDETPYRLLTADGVATFEAGGRRFVTVDPAVLTELTSTAMFEISHLLRPGHLTQLAAILDDPEASANDRFVAIELLKNACIAAGGVLPSCQDTGTAIVKGKKGEQVLTGGGDREAIARGIFRTYNEHNLRYSQMAPLSMFDEKNTGTNLPAEIEIESVDGDAYKLLFMAKGGGSANKSFLFQETQALLNPESLLTWLDEKLRTLGTAACPPYHLAVVIGGTSAEATLKTAKLASARYLDSLPDDGNELGRGFRDRELEARSAEAHAGVRHRRAVRRQVLLPRRARDPLAASRRVVSRCRCGVVLGRPPVAREDHGRRRVPRTARDRSGAVSARRRARRTGRRPRRDRPQPADGRDPQHAVALPGEDTCDAERPDGRGARHRARQDQGAARRAASACRSTCATSACTTRDRRRRPRVWRRVRSGRPPRAAWTPTSTSSKLRAARS